MLTHGPACAFYNHLEAESRAAGGQGTPIPPTDIPKACDPSCNRSPSLTSPGPFHLELPQVPSPTTAPDLPLPPEARYSL